MKFSKYLFVLRRGFCSLIFSCKTDAVSAIDNQLADFIESGQLDYLEQKHQDFFAFLKREGFIVEDNVDECDDIIKAWKKEEQSPTLSIFINPTMDCNLRCWYCYEKHVPKSMMQQNVVDSILKLATHEIAARNIKMLSLSFFGGEPLLGVDTVIIPLLKAISDLAQKNGIIVQVSLVTNGVLLTEKNVVRLQSLSTGNQLTCQVTLDGNEFFHNKTKCFSNGVGTYAKILQNVKKALKLGVHITLRFNTTTENLPSYADVLDDLGDIPTEERSRLHIDFQHVWQDDGEDTMMYMDRQEKLRERFVDKGFTVNELKHIDNSRCYADRKNHYTINYNGDVFKCTAREFSSNNREGVLTSEGEVIWNTKNEKREELKYGNESCHRCNIFPICHGGCCQFKMESMAISDCIRGYSQKDKDKIVNDRVDYIISNKIKN